MLEYHITRINCINVLSYLQIPMAKASILWLVGEYSNLVSKIAPDVLRKVAKTFPNEVSVSHMIIT